MSEGVEVTPPQKFQAGVKKALKYGKVFVQGEAVSDSQDVANQVATASPEESKWLGVLFPSLKMTALSKEEASAGKDISALLASLSYTAEGS